MEALLIILVVLNTLILIGIVVGLAIILRKIGRATDAAQNMLDEVNREIGPTLRATQDALRGVESLTTKSEEQLDRVGSVLSDLDRILSGVAVVEVASKAIKSSRTTLSSVLTGIREGLRVLKSHDGETKEG